MSHLGERLSAFVDGELGHTDRERVLSHLTACEACRFEAEMLRTLKRRLHTLGSPEPSMDFLGRLSTLSAAAPSDDPPPGPPPMGGPARFGSAPPLGSSRPIGGGPVFGGTGGAARMTAQPPPAPEPAPAATRLPRFRPNWNRARYAVAGASVVAVTLSAAFVAGEERPDTPVVTPALADYAVEHAVVSGQAPLPGSVTVPAGPLPVGGETVGLVEPVNDDSSSPGTDRPR